jgi:putative radical SAM enzyme (TIGR03279 family)
MPAIVSDVEVGSIAEELEIESGDILLSIDGEKLSDLIDYRFYCKSEELTIEIQKKNGEIEEIELEKDYDEDLGIIFESAVFDKIKPCLNKCIFCFVDQQPKGLRDTLYIKDDDYRLSYLQGTYITLTNLTEKDKDRISRMHLGPFYISVHTTNPELRVKMQRNPNASKIMEQLEWFKSEEIPFHAQIVLCPEFNDGEELERTLKDLDSLGDCLLSVAIVPVGITTYRKGDVLKRVDERVAKETIRISSKYPKVCCSDEFFLLAGESIPQTEYYGNFCQLDDGVGSIRALLDDFYQLDVPKKLREDIDVTFATSYAGRIALEEISAELNKVEGLTCRVAPVRSDYWGENITVAGLITSEDLIRTVKDIETDYVVIPAVMLKPFSELFLDGNDLDYVREKTGKNFFVVHEQYSLGELVDFLSTFGE